MYCLLMTAGSVYLSYRLDRETLTRVARQATAGRVDPADRALALMHWVHAIQGTRENPRYFLLPSLRATPLQVLADGGDCADKSRLLAALLNGVGLEATPVLCMHSVFGRPTHTVVSTRLGHKASMVMDPAYELYFPKPDGSGFFGLLELRRDETILARRLQTVRESSPRRHPVHSYDPVAASYLGAASINWNKNNLTRAARSILLRLLGEDVFLVRRPAFLEEPKLFVSVALALACLSAVGLRAVLTHVGRVGRAVHTTHRRPAHERPAPAAQLYSPSFDG